MLLLLLNSPTTIQRTLYTSEAVEEKQSGKLTPRVLYSYDTSAARAPPHVRKVNVNVPPRSCCTKHCITEKEASAASACFHDSYFELNFTRAIGDS